MANAVCVYVRNEQDDILEWIIYNTVIGFDTVIVMDNLSDDNTVAQARRAQAHFDVRIESWPDTSAHAQRKCYDHVLQTYGPEFEWIAFIDSDEFIVPVQHGSVPAFLASLPPHAAIGLNWAIYGSSGHEATPGALVIDSFRHRAEASFLPNRHIKSFVQPALTASCAHPHLFHLKDERWDADGRYRSDYIDAKGHMIEWGPEPGLTLDAPDLSVCRVNHYFTRSRAHWMRKMDRRWRDVERSDDAFLHHDRNEIPDDTATVFLDRVRAAIASLG